MKKRRLQLKLLQSQAARKLRVSTVTLSRWERDLVYPSWAYQPRLIRYLDYNPFTQPALGTPRGNETNSVAILSSEAAITFPELVQKRRLELRKNKKQFAEVLGVDPKTLRDWERRVHSPFAKERERVLQMLTSSKAR